jgi:hypothetical protein
LRYKIGYDWGSYADAFDRSIKVNQNLHMESGFIFLNKIFKIGTNNYFILQFFIAAFSSICLYKFVKTYTDYPLVALLLYFSQYYFAYNMGLTRQLIALMLSLDSVK